MDKIIEKQIVDILTKELLLDSDHIWIYSQNRKMPQNADGLYCMVGEIDSQIVSAKSYFNDSIAGANEIQEVVEFCSVQIDLMSYSNEARDRRAEVIMALNSFYAQELMEKEQFRIFEIPSRWVNMGRMFGGSEVNMFSIVITCNLTTRKIKNTSYYDTFNVNTRIQDVLNVSHDSLHFGQDE